MGIFNWLFGGKKYSKEFIKENTHRLYDSEQNIYSEGLMINGKKEGLWKIFDENNNLIIERKYRWNIIRSEKIIKDNFLKEKDDADPIDPAHDFDFQKHADDYENGVDHSMKINSKPKSYADHITESNAGNKKLGRNGKPHGNIKEYYENGNVRLDFNYKDGIQHGKQIQYYEDGTKDMIVNFKNGVEHGLKEQYYPSGHLETRTTYVDGLMEGVHIYLKENGEVIEEKIMQKGLDITMELMQLMLDNDSEHMLKAGLIKDGVQAFEPGQMSQEIYDYYKRNNLKVDSAQVSALKEMYKKGEIDKDFFDSSMSALNQ